MEPSVRFLIGFLLICQLFSMANCRVIKQNNGHEKEIKENEGKYEQSNGTTIFKSTLHDDQVKLFETSIIYTNATQLLSGSNMNALALVLKNHQIDSRSFSKWKRSIKKFVFAWTYYGPELGLCSCLFKYAWFTYPNIPKVTLASLGRARQMISRFMYNFWEGYAEEESNAHYRISSKVADMSAADYYHYKNNIIYYVPHRRDGNYVRFVPENAPIVEKANTKLVNVVEMLKNLQPKANISDFVIPLVNHIKTQARKPHNASHFYIVSDKDEIEYDNVVKGRSSVEVLKKPNIDRTGFDITLPNLSPFIDLPPDYTFYENGVYHHIHDLRNEKGHYSKKNKRRSGVWLSFDFEDAILTALGLSHPGRSIKPSVVKCSKIYAFQVVIRFIQSIFLG